MPRSRPPVTADSSTRIWQERTDLVKQEVAAASAAMDAKTNKLRALRLEKEARDAEEAARQPAKEPARPKPRKRKT